MNQLFSIDLLGLKVVDIVSSDKIYPPHFKTVQNRQPVPEGAFKKRDGLVDGDVNTTAKQWECQLITPFFLKGSPNTDTIAAFSEQTTDDLCYIYKNVAGVWSQITGTSIINDGFYYVCNALTTVLDVITPVLVIVKSDNTGGAFGDGENKNCCLAILRNPSDGAITVKSIGNDSSLAAPTIKTINWQSAMCVEYHLNKLWVGGLRESKDPDLVAASDNALVNRHNRIRWSKTGDLRAVSPRHSSRTA